MNLCTVKEDTQEKTRLLSYSLRSQRTEIPHTFKILLPYRIMKMYFTLISLFTTFMQCLYSNSFSYMRRISCNHSPLKAFLEERVEGRIVVDQII